MVRRGKRGGRRFRRNKMRRSRNRPTPNRSSQVIRNTSVVSVRVPAIRDFTVYAVLPSDSVSLEQFVKDVNLGVAATKSVWLDALKAIGIFALKIFVTTLLSQPPILFNGRKYLANKMYITGAVQSVFIGAEDLLHSSPLVERVSKVANKITYEIPCLDYCQARMTRAIVRITPGSDWKDRAGRYAIACLNISEEEWNAYYPTTKTNVLRRGDSWTFQEVVQMPGAAVAPFGIPITVTWKAHPYSYANRFLEIGQHELDGWDFSTNLLGGKPCFRLIIAYQSFASASGKVADTYSPNSALVQLDMRAHIALQESKRTYIRSWPLITMDTKEAGVQGTSRVVSLNEMSVVNGDLYHVRSEELSLADLSMEG